MVTRVDVDLNLHSTRNENCIARATNDRSILKVDIESIINPKLELCRLQRFDDYLESKMRVLTNVCGNRACHFTASQTCASLVHSTRALSLRVAACSSRLPFIVSQLSGTKPRHTLLKQEPPPTQLHGTSAQFSQDVTRRYHQDQEVYASISGRTLNLC